VKREVFALGLGIALFAHAGVARADDGGLEDGAIDDGAVDDGGPEAGGPCNTDGAAACAFNQYCAYPDGGAIQDGAPGVCLFEPCLAASDCTNPTYPICDTSQNPFQCVECISTADCPGVLVCDTATHICVNPPPVPDASDDAGLVPDAADAAPDADAAPPIDAAPSEDAPVASEDASDGSVPVIVAPPDEGSLGGGSWDCELATPAQTPLAAMGISFVVALLFVARRRSLRERR
jgi:hypothetical protein